MSFDQRLARLNTLLQGFERCTVAFSGGVDSTFLLAAAIRVLGKNKVTAITVVPPYVAGWEVSEAKELAEELGCLHITVESEMLEEVKNNPADRCYLCKSALFSGMLKLCNENGYGVLCDGTNADDTGDHRPGMRALKELGVRSPMLEVGMTKDEIRSISREWELPTWDKPPYACLLTRLPHDTLVSAEELERIEKSEVALIEAGFPYVRVRHHAEIARIELPPNRFEEFISSGCYEEIAGKLKRYGYRFVTLDLNGYTMGNMNVIEESS